MSLELIKDSKKLVTAIKSIANRGKKLDADIHLCAVSCLYHAQEHGDTTLMTRLVDAMPKSGRRKALIHWAVEHGKLAYSEKEQTFKLDKGKSKSWKLAAAESTPFWEFTVEKAPQDVTLEGLIKMVHNKIVKAKEDGRLEKGFTTEDFVAKMKTDLATVEV